jgi:ACT domain-containing protein
MMMIVDIAGASKATGEIITDLEHVGEDIGVMIRMQMEEIFTKMHRI